MAEKYSKSDFHHAINRQDHTYEIDEQENGITFTENCYEDLDINKGNSFYLTYAATDDSNTPHYAAVTHEIIDNGNGSYNLKQKCSIPDAEKLNLYLQLSNTAEQIDFMRKALNSYQPACSRFVINHEQEKYECASLPYKEDLKNFSKENRLLYCNVPESFDFEAALMQNVRSCRPTTSALVDDQLPLSQWHDEHIWTKHKYVVQQPNWICNDGSKSKDLCTFREIKNDLSLPNCNEQDGLNYNGNPNRDGEDYRAQIENLKPHLKDQNIFIFGGDSVSNQIKQILKRISGGAQYHIKTVLNSDAFGRDGGGSSWTSSIYWKYEPLNLRFYFAPHGSPMLGNKNSDIGKSTADKIKAIREIITGDGRNFHVLIGQGFHFSSGNPAIMIKEYFDCNTEARKLLADFPGLKFYYKELHWLKFEKDAGLHVFFFGNWNFYRQNLIAERVLEDFWEKVDTWNYIFTRHARMETHNPHPPLDPEILYVVKSFLQKVVKNVKEE